MGSASAIRCVEVGILTSVLIGCVRYNFPFVHTIGSGAYFPLLSHLCWSMMIFPFPPHLFSGAFPFDPPLLRRNWLQIGRAAMDHDECLFAFLSDAVIEVSDVLQLLRASLMMRFCSLPGTAKTTCHVSVWRDRHRVELLAGFQWMCGKRLSGFFTDKGGDRLMSEQNGVVRLVELPRDADQLQLNMVIIKIQLTRFWANHGNRKPSWVTSKPVRVKVMVLPRIRVEHRKILFLSVR